MPDSCCTGKRSKIFPCITNREYVPPFHLRANSKPQDRKGRRLVAGAAFTEVRTSAFIGLVKPEIRMSKPERNPKSETRNPVQVNLHCTISNFELRHSSFFRISAFG